MSKDESKDERRREHEKAGAEDENKRSEVAITRGDKSQVRTSEEKRTEFSLC